jgi:hypothetical protein
VNITRNLLQYQSTKYISGKDIELIEGVRRRESKVIKLLKNETYENRFKKLHLKSMETRRLRGELTEVFKMFKRMDKLDVNNFFR